MPQLNFSTILRAVPREETLYIRAFAPWKTFAFGFSGDNRSFTTSRAKDVTSRVNGVVKFLIPSLVVLSQYAYSDPSHYRFYTRTGHPTITATGGNGKMHVEEAGSNPLVPSADTTGQSQPRHGELFAMCARVAESSNTALNGVEYPLRARMLSLLGFAVTASMVWLGAVWPSYYTIVAIPILPAPFIFIAAVIRPSIIGKPGKLRKYLFACTVLSIVCLLDEMVWLRFNVSIFCLFRKCYR